MFARTDKIQKLSLTFIKMPDSKMPEDAVTVLCYKYQSSLRQLLLSGFRLTDDFLHIVSMMDLTRLVIENCDCTFSTAMLLKFLRTKTDDGSLQELQMKINHFQFTMDEEQDFIHLLHRLKHFRFVVQQLFDDERRGRITVSNFNVLDVLDYRNNNVSAETLISKRKPLLDKTLEVHTQLTDVDIGVYSCDANILLQNRGLKRLVFGGSVTDNDMMAFSRLEHLESFVLTSKAPLNVTAAGIMLLLTGRSAHCIKRIEVKKQLYNRLSNESFQMLCEEVERMNKSRDMQNLVELELGHDNVDEYRDENESH